MTKHLKQKGSLGMNSNREIMKFEKGVLSSKNANKKKFFDFKNAVEKQLVPSS
jgi:hypothetical protein